MQPHGGRERLTREVDQFSPTSRGHEHRTANFIRIVIRWGGIAIPSG
jgi:hypothetical protein